MATDFAPPYLLEGIVLLASALITVPLAKRFGLGSVLGYLAAGFAVGPFGIGLISDPEGIIRVAELGIVLLLFMIGLELQPARLWQMKRDIFSLGTSQVILSGLLLMGIGVLSGFDLRLSFIAGFGLALSSTAFSLQLLQERGQLSTRYGRRAFSILLLQDIAIVPLLSVLSFMALPDQSLSSGPPLWREILNTSAAIIFVIIVGRYLLTPFFNILARFHAREGLLTAVLFVTLGSATFLHLFGLSMALGAFLAGVMLAESSYRHTLEADIDPFRSLLMGLFFIGVGMSLDVTVLLQVWPAILIGVVIVLSVKSFILWGLSRLFGSNNSDALYIAATLPQGGEFAFVLFATAVASELMPKFLASALIAVVIITMIMTPFMVYALDYLARRLKKEGVTPDLVKGLEDVKPRVLIVGLGRFGMIVTQMLAAEGVDITAIDYLPDRIRKARKMGYQVFYGDATRADVMRIAGAGHATLIALCLKNDKTMTQTIEMIKQEFPCAALFCRANNRAHALLLEQLGVDYQIREIFESSIVFGRKALDHLGIPYDRVAQIESDLRKKDSDVFNEEMSRQLDEEDA